MSQEESKWEEPDCDNSLFHDRIKQIAVEVSVWQKLLLKKKC